MPIENLSRESTEYANGDNAVVRTGAPESPTLTPEQRTLRAQLAAHESWARTTDRAGRTAAARNARWKRYEDKARELHPGAPPEVVEQAAEHLRIADMKRMALKSAAVRRQKTLARHQAAHDGRG